MEDKGEKKKKKKKENNIEPIIHSEADRLKESLQELKELRSQLHNAADHCETLFLKAKQKKIVMENTKSYLCQAIVTVIDHLGTVSSKLEQRLHESNKVSQIEQRIDCLRQRALTCQQYSVDFDLSTFQWSSKFHEHYGHYTSSPYADDHTHTTDFKFGKEILKGTKLFVPVPFIQGSSNPFSPLFETQSVEDHLKGISNQKKKPVQKNSLYSALRRSKRWS
ncbi:ABI family protein [Dioscorea alata]|uniref:ABI family protein n=1 Tax=Dioscorea alata TaxID=55571 RepID=A0ACB7WCG6_DIOAL|nr:ABI family protein [Dioscorea alata]